MRGAPQVGFSATIRRSKARTSLLTRLRPPTRLTLEIQDQYKRNPARCQFTTVLGVTKTRGSLHPDQHVFNATQNSLCRAPAHFHDNTTCSVIAGNPPADAAQPSGINGIMLLVPIKLK